MKTLCLVFTVLAAMSLSGCATIDRMWGGAGEQAFWAGRCSDCYKAGGEWVGRLGCVQQSVRPTMCTEDRIRVEGFDCSEFRCVGACKEVEK